MSPEFQAFRLPPLNELESSNDRWREEVGDEVLARLLDLNAKRAQEERLSGAAARGKKKTTRKKTSKKKRKSKAEAETGELF